MTKYLYYLEGIMTTKLERLVESRHLTFREVIVIRNPGSPTSIIKVKYQSLYLRSWLNESLCLIQG